MRRILAIVAAVLLLLTACGGDEPDETSDGDSAGSEDRYEQVLEEIEGLTGEDRTQKLLELAADEAMHVDWYTSMNQDVAQAAADAFEDKYEITVGLYRADNTPLIARALEEHDAGVVGSDVIETSGDAAALIAAEGIFAPYESEYQDDLIDGSVHESWTAVRYNNFVIIRNTEEVSESEMPTSWEELADPKWDGRIALGADDADWYMPLWLYWTEEQGKSEEEANQLFEEIADGAKFVSSHTLMQQLLAAGEYPLVGESYSYVADILASDGAPISYSPTVSPVFVRAGGGSVSAGAAHPATATLFMDWLIGEGQESLLGANLSVARADLQPDVGDAELIQVDVERLAEEDETWSERYASLVSLGEVIE